MTTETTNTTPTTPTVEEWEEVPLSRPYTCTDGAPVIDRVSMDLFAYRYFMRCMSCTFCNDVCCQYGVDVDATNVERIMAAADAIEPLARAPRDQWFTGEWTDDPEYPGGRNTRTAVIDGSCVFLARNARGCVLHSHALTVGRDYHELKPLMSSLFPASFENGLLCVALEVTEKELVCLDQGPTVYEGVRDELGHYFGKELVAELDALALKSRS
jgi:Fe-S-cluster containining protein